MYENSLVWTPYDGFNNGLDRYEVLRKETTDAGVWASPWPRSCLSGNHEDEVGDEFDSPGTPSATVGLGSVRFHGDAQGSIQLGVPDRGSHRVDSQRLHAQPRPNQRLVPLASRTSPSRLLGEPQGDNPNFKMDIVSRWGTPSFSRSPSTTLGTDASMEEWSSKACTSRTSNTWTARGRRSNRLLDGPSRKMISPQAV